MPASKRHAVTLRNRGGLDVRWDIWLSGQSLRNRGAVAGKILSDRR